LANLARQWACCLFFRCLHVEAKKFERSATINPTMPRMRLEQNHVIGLLADITIRFAIFVIQGHLAGSADDVKNVCLFRRSLVQRDHAIGVHVPAHHIDAFADVDTVGRHRIKRSIIEALVWYTADVRYRRELAGLLFDRDRFAAGVEFNARQIARRCRGRTLLRAATDAATPVWRSPSKRSA
jgi:hypothetical protein